jgi:predicted amidohydrolase
MSVDAGSGGVRVAVCQLELRIGDLDGNRAAAQVGIEDAAAQGAQVVVLPELTPSGYVFEDPAEARSLGERPDGPTGQQWFALAKARDLVIIGGFAELTDDADGRPFNSAMLVDQDGIRAVYRKAHLWDAEADSFATGDQPPPVTATKYGRVAMMICYDVEFPEWVRLPALAGAELLAVPTNWPAEPVPAGERSMLTMNVQVAAFSNRMFVAAACRCGTERGVPWVGGSVIAGPNGYPLAGPASTGGIQGQKGQPGEAASEILIADCDLRLARDKSTGPRNDAFADRRPALYGKVAS